ncbi:MAG: hypothetical protein K5986_11040 [Clostridium sp.]|uniref:hypothetical protein n=1 Tax=Clostridium sp. DSM 8431 TaxID=1761781 RepID=UPI0008DFE2D2|nr:hypothetical protein [Clostridium sp. DSM 8431]MCR4944949.1 hypothetical protein [Clostridium sp.]SFU56157.1 hypothetical protein SAMN04487886_10583 [Clostridium sp. DSM 8431]
MPLSKGSRGKKISRKDRIELSAVIKFIKYIQLLACCILAISTVGMIIARKDEGAFAIYLMVIVVNLIIVLLGRIPIKYLMKKDL